VEYTIVSAASPRAVIILRSSGGIGIGEGDALFSERGGIGERGEGATEALFSPSLIAAR